MARQQHKNLSKGSSGQNRNLSASFIGKYQSRSDVNMTDTGLMYRIISNSDGQAPGFEHSVKVHQRILLADGTVVDDTYKSGIVEAFRIDEAIDGLQQGLQLMPTGARYEFVIPAQLAWGKKGNGGKIGPNAVMIVDVRLLAFT